MIVNEIFIKGLRGVGQVSINFAPESNIRVLVGSNGIGKTKTLEAIFQALLFSNEIFGQTRTGAITDEAFLFNSVRLNTNKVDRPRNAVIFKSWQDTSTFKKHALPVLYLGSQQRGVLAPGNKVVAHIGTFEERRSSYFDSVASGMNKNFESLSMDAPIASWFVTLANSSNPYQKKQDNRGFEMQILLRILNRIDSRIDGEFLEITGDGSVNILIERNIRNITQLSSGFTAILKIVQAIISGYGYFSNDLNLEKVKGYVLIDEIDSHLHLSWQTKIVPLLSEIFPNTIFIVTTHSPLVCSALNVGEVYQLDRDISGEVISKEIALPKSAMLIDTIRDGFGIDLNRNKLENFDWKSNSSVKNDLLKLINETEEK